MEVRNPFLNPDPSFVINVIQIKIFFTIDFNLKLNSILNCSINPFAAIEIRIQIHIRS